MNRLLVLCSAVISITGGPMRAQIEIPSGGTIRKLAVPRGAAGSSYAKPVIITASEATSGIGSEYRFVSAHFPGSTVVNHRREYYSKRTYDVLTFTTREGEKRALYFEYQIHRQ